MGSPRNKVCVLSSLDAEEYQKSGVRPCCRHHGHMSRKEAIRLTRQLLYQRTNSYKHTTNVYEAQWIKDVATNHPFAIMFPDPKRWVIRKSGHVSTHQLISSKRR